MLTFILCVGSFQQQLCLIKVSQSSGKQTLSSHQISDFHANCILARCWDLHIKAAEGL
jgi:hypothetical protein